MAWDDPQLYALAAEFFRAFSRMEYSLKAVGIMAHGRRDAQVDWKKFAESMKVEFENPKDSKVVDAIEFLLENPPKKQINVQGQLQWDTSAPDASCKAELILLYVRRVRNNLFHGGKFNGRWFNPERSGGLIQACLVVLKYSRKCSPDVDRAYRYGAAQHGAAPDRP